MNKANKIKWIVVFVLLIALTAGVIFSVVKICKLDKTKNLSALNYQVGTIDINTGKYVKDTGYLVTKDYVSLDGLTVALKKGASVEVYVALFNKNSELITADPSMGATFKVLSPDENSEVVWTFDKDVYSSDENYKPVKASIIIKPLHDTEVSWTEISTYSKQVVVTTNK